MLTKIKGIPAHVLGIRASGVVSEKDIRTVLRPALDELSERTGQLSYLLVLDTDVQNFTAAAWWQDMLAGLEHLADWERIDVVTDQKPVELFTDLFELGVPGRSKGFRRDQLAEAKLWVATAAPARYKTVALVLGGLAMAGLTFWLFTRTNKK